MPNPYDSMPMRQIHSLDLKACESRDARDKAALMDYFNQLDGGADAASKVVKSALVRVSRFRWRRKAILYTSVGCFCVAMPAVCVCVVLYLSGGETDPELRPAYQASGWLFILTCCAFCGLSCGERVYGKRMIGGRALSLGPRRQEPAAIRGRGGRGHESEPVVLGRE